MMDTSDDPEQLAKKVHKRLSRELFSYTLEANPAFQGMEHLHRELAEASGIEAFEQAQRALKEWDINGEGRSDLIERAQRVNIALKSNPGIINPQLHVRDKQRYTQLLYSYAPILAMSL